MLYGKNPIPHKATVESMKNTPGRLLKEIFISVKSLVMKRAKSKDEIIKVKLKIMAVLTSTPKSLKAK